MKTKKRITRKAFNQLTTKQKIKLFQKAVMEADRVISEGRELKKMAKKERDLTVPVFVTGVNAIASYIKKDALAQIKRLEKAAQ